MANYLTDEELKMPREEVNLQIALGLRSCRTLEDVCKLLDDVRTRQSPSPATGGACPVRDTGNRLTRRHK